MHHNHITEGHKLIQQTDKPITEEFNEDFTLEKN